ncbi:MAG: competence/damage-inducible protein A [Sedimentisphaerales bacterium]|nr:competence/damage-inducible protein A [Sedimentisphaerales bacterium]
MQNAAIITVGNELLNGYAVDTNSSWLAGKLLLASIPVVYSCSVSDDIEEIKEAIQYASGKADIILITGGLGPTDDDLTRNGLAKFLGVELEYHDEIYDKIKKLFKARKYSIPEKNKVQAYLPAGTSEIENTLGTAPGILYENDKKIIAAMPGVPSEMQKMFEESILPKLFSRRRHGDDFFIIRKIKCIGAGESTIAEMLGDLMARDRNPQINCTVSQGIITLHIIARAEDKKSAEKMAAEDVEKLSGILGKLVYGFDEQSLAEVVGQKLSEQKKTLATAESCTGGLIAKMITDIPGSSSYFTGGWVTYNNEAKISQLGVEKGLIEKFGAVSSEVSAAMAAGARQRSGADFAIAVTGIAGPAGGTEQKPVGLVFISIAGPRTLDTEQFLFGPRNRDFIRLRTCQNALNLLRLKLGS